MTVLEMLEQSSVLTLLGMGIVFSFLLILIISVSVVGKIMHALGLDKEPLPTARASAPSQSEAITAAISAAVTQYRKDH